MTCSGDPTSTDPPSRNSSSVRNGSWLCRAPGESMNASKIGRYPSTASCDVFFTYSPLNPAPTTARRQLGGLRRRRRPVPQRDAVRPVRPRLRGRVRQRRAITPRPGNSGFPEQSPEQLVLLPVPLPLPVQLVPEQRVLVRVVSLPDDDVQPSARQLVERRVVLGHPYRIQQRQHRHRGQQPDPRRHRRDVGQYDRRRRRDEPLRVPLPHAVPVEAQLLRPLRLLDDVPEPLGRRQLHAADRVRRVVDQRVRTELHLSVTAPSSRPRSPADRGDCPAPAPGRSRTP